MEELFSLTISEGAICNILARARRLCERHGNDRESRARQPGGLLGRDVSAVKQNWWEWVFIGTLRCCM